MGCLSVPVGFLTSIVPARKCGEAGEGGGEEAGLHLTEGAGASVRPGRGAITLRQPAFGVEADFAEEAGEDDRGAAGARVGIRR